MLDAIFIALPFAVVILLGLVLGLVLCALVWGLYVNPLTGVWLLVFLYVADLYGQFMWGGTMPPLKFGRNLYPQDLVLSTMALAVLLRVLAGGQLARIPKSAVLLWTLMLISFALGMIKFGIGTAGNEFRADFYFWVATAYFVSFPMTREHLSGFVRAWVFAALATLGVVFYHWGTGALGFAPRAWRAVSSGQAMLLGQTLILLVYAMASGAGLRFWRFLVPILAIAVILLQHRSVWVAVFGPLVLAAVLVGKARVTLARNLAVVVLVLAMVLVTFFATTDVSPVTSALQKSVDTALTTKRSGKATFVGRWYDWGQVLGDWMGSGLRAFVMGNPYGSGYVVKQTAAYSRERIGWNPHNFYIQTLVRTGVIGLAALLAIYWMVLRCLKREESLDHPDVSAAAFIGLLVSQMIYFLVYGAGSTQGMVLGIALSLVRDGSLGWCRPSLHGHNTDRRSFATNMNVSQKTKHLISRR